MSTISGSITSKVHCISEDNGDFSEVVEVLIVGSSIDSWLTGIAAGSGVVATGSGVVGLPLQAPNQVVYITRFLMRWSILIWH